MKDNNKEIKNKDKDEGECIFCKISKGEINVDKIYENENFFSFPDANPVAKGHSLIIPKNHFKTALDLPSSLGQELLDCIKNTTMKLMKEDESIDGFNIVSNNFPSAGQAVHHVHFHIIPRKKDDGKILSLHDKK
ncbi:HIT domain-containing protein [Candidatus Pacearchaeota archaeon]|nr:HIT domain-containing protein [Candidatus Pacearchaeota archaeon]